MTAKTAKEITPEQFLLDEGFIYLSKILHPLYGIVFYLETTDGEHQTVVPEHSWFRLCTWIWNKYNNKH